MQERLYKWLLSLMSSAVMKMIEPSFPALQALCVILALDVGVGIYQSFKYEGKKFDPKKLLSKFKEIGMFVIIVAAIYVIHPFWKQYSLETFSVANYFISAYGFYHFLSLIQNMGKMGFPIAGYFQKWIESKVPEMKDLKEATKEGETNENKK